MTPDLIAILAAVMAGEAGILGDDAMLGVGHGIMNRVVSPYFPDTVMEVLFQPGQWNGWEDPTEHHRSLAKAVLRRDHDPTGGMLYAYSEQDRQRLGFPEGDKVYGTGRVFRVHLYKEYPGDRSERVPDTPDSSGALVLCSVDLVTASEAVALE